MEGLNSSDDVSMGATAVDVVAEVVAETGIAEIGALVEGSGVGYFVGLNVVGVTVGYLLGEDVVGAGVIWIGL